MKVSEDLELFVPPSDGILALLELLGCLWISQPRSNVPQLHTHTLSSAWNARVTERNIDKMSQ